MLRSFFSTSLCVRKPHTSVIIFVAIYYAEHFLAEKCIHKSIYVICTQQALHRCAEILLCNCAQYRYIVVQEDKNKQEVVILKAEIIAVSISRLG